MGIKGQIMKRQPTIGVDIILETAKRACKKHHEGGICTCGKPKPESNFQIEHPKQKVSNYWKKLEKLMSEM